MRKFTLLFILLPLLGFSQIAKVEKLQELKVETGLFHNFHESEKGEIIIESIIKKTKKGNYSEYERNIDPFVQKIAILNNNLEVENRREKYNRKNIEIFIKTIKISNNKYISITGSSNNTNKRTYSLLIHNFNNMFYSKKKEVEIEYIEEQHFYYPIFVDYTVYQSSDKSKFAIIETRRSETGTNLFISCFDSNANLLWNKNLYCWTNKNIIETTFSYAITNEGHVLVLTNYQLWSEAEKKYVSNINFIDIHSENHRKRIEISYENFRINKAKIVNLNNMFICVGYMTKRIYPNTIEGIHSFYIDLKNESIYDLKEEKFRDEMTNDVLTMKNESFKTKTNRKITISKTIKLDDGSLIILGEDSYDLISYGEINSAEYFTGVIYASKIDATGKLVWSTAIPKLQIFKNPTYGKFNSFDYIQLNDKLYFIFNDHKDNLNNYNISNGSLLTDAKNNKIIIAEMNLETGKYKKEEIFPKSKEQYLFTRKALLTKNNKIIMLIQKGKKTMICQLSIN